MSTIQNLFQQAQLAEAAYANLMGMTTSTSPDALKLALTTGDGTFTTTQASAFAARYQVISHQPNTDSGFSATLFLDTTTGQYTFAARGTEPGPTDLAGADFGDIVMDGLAMDQIVDMYNYWKSLNTATGDSYQAAKLETSITETAELAVLHSAAFNPLTALLGLPAYNAYVDQLKASGAVLDSTLLGTVVRRVSFDDSSTVLAGTEIALGSGALTFTPSLLNVAGHSLGGHLAAAFTRLFPTVASNAVTINGAGFPTGSTPGLGGNALSNIDNLFQRLHGAGEFNSGSITNIHGDGPNFVSMNSEYGLVQQGDHQEIYIESMDAGNIFGHGKEQMTDSLALYNLLATLDTTLNDGSAANLGKITNLLKASSNVAENSLESTVSALGRLFNVTGAAGFNGNEFDANRDLLYQAVQDIAAALPEQSTHTLRDLSLFDAAQIASIAKDNIAYRYALVAGNPFAVVGDATLYDTHNANGELDLHNPDNGTGSLTTQYLADRAAWLDWKTNYDSGQYDDNDGVRTTVGDKPYTEQWDSDATQGNWDYIDHTFKPDGEPLTLAIDGAGLSEYDHQIVFGSKAADTVEGSGDTDRLYGMAGDDTLQGMAGRDYLEGGQGNDTYIWNSGLLGGDGIDTILDTDGIGSIQLDGQILGAGETKDGGRTYTHTDANDIKHSYTVLAGDINSAQGATVLIDGTLRVLNYHAGDLGLTLGEAAPQPTPEIPAITRTIVGDYAPAEFNAELAADASPDPAWTVRDQQIGSFHTVYTTDSSYIVIDTYVYTYWLKDDLGNWITGQAEPDRNDVLNGSGGSDHILSGGGDDLINAAGGDNYIEAGDGDNSVWTGAGNDYIQTGNGNDYINAGHGDNYAGAGAGRDRVNGGAGKDLLIGGADSDILDSGAGDDRLYADMQQDTATAIAQGNTQTCTGVTGDWLNAGDGNDTLIGSNANDLLAGGTGDDLLIAGAGDDVLLGDNETFPGNFPDQTWHYDAQAQDIILHNFIHNHPPEPATSGNDVIHAGAGNDYAFGGYGNDVIYGEADDDTLQGNSGNDVLFGGIGKDRLYGDLQDNDAIAPMPGDDYLDGGDDDDLIYGNEGNDILIGGKGADHLYGGAGQDTYLFNKGDGIDHLHDTRADKNIIRFGAGITAADKANAKLHLGSLVVDFGNGDAIHFENEDQANANGFDQNDVFNSSPISGFEFEDGSTLSINELLVRGFDLEGTSGDDIIAGTNTTDRISGFEGNDALQGGAGDDILIGGKGDDTLFGDTGRDTYIINQGDGVDTIDDTLSGNSIFFGAGIGAANIKLRTGSLMLDLGNGDAVHIAGFNTQDVFNSVSIGSFVFADGTVLTATELLERGFDLDGTEAGETITGTNTTDRISGLGGDDTLFGADGDDILDGGTGTDVLQAGDGNDTLNGGAGNDTLFGEAGNDTLSGGDGADQLQGNDGNDLIVGGIGNDNMWGDAGDDAFVFNLGDGQDTMEDTAGQDRIRFGAGILASDLVIDSFWGGSAQYLYIGYSATDSVSIKGGFLGSIELYKFADGTTLTHAELLQNAPALYLEGTNQSEVIQGGGRNDRILGFAGNDTLIGGGGDDSLFGGAGNNLLIGGPGYNELFGDIGSDTPFFRTSPFLRAAAISLPRISPAANDQSIRKAA